MLRYDSCLVVPASHLDTDTLACEKKKTEKQKRKEARKS